jgi:hypothetical protein
MKGQDVSYQHSRKVLKMSNDDSKQEEKTRRGLTLYGANPFIVAGLVKPKTKRITNKKGDCMIVGETGEIVAPVAGFWQAQEVDAAKFVKLYINGVKAFKELTNAGTKVFELLYLEVQKNISKDRVYLSFSTIDNKETKISQATFTRGMRELIDKGFVAPTIAIGWYWLNLDFMWNGDRLAFVQEYRKSKSANAYDPRQQSLELELTDPSDQN